MVKIFGLIVSSSIRSSSFMSCVRCFPPPTLLTASLINGCDLRVPSSYRPSVSASNPTSSSVMRSKFSNLFKLGVLPGRGDALPGERGEEGLLDFRRAAGEGGADFEAARSDRESAERDFVLARGIVGGVLGKEFERRGIDCM